MANAGDLPGLSSPLAKNLPLYRLVDTPLEPSPSNPSEGRFAIVTNAGWDAMDAGRAADENVVLRTAKPCGPGTPTLVSSW